MSLKTGTLSTKYVIPGCYLTGRVICARFCRTVALAWHFLSHGARRHSTTFIEQKVKPFDFFFFSNFVIVVINCCQDFRSPNSVCNRNCDWTNRTPASRSSDFVTHSYDYRQNWTPFSPTLYYHYLNVWLMKLPFLFRQPTGILVSMRLFCIQSCPEILITVSPLILLAVLFPLPARWTEKNTTLTFYWFVCQISMVTTVLE